MNGRLCFSCLVVATVVALLCTVNVSRFYQKKTTMMSSSSLGYRPLSEAAEEEVITKQDSRYVNRNKTAIDYNATSAVAKESGPISLAMVDKNSHSVGYMNAPKISSSEVSSTELASPTTSPRSGLGYMLAFHYSDQLTGSTANLLSLMCLATKIGGVRVVEPLVVASRLGVNGSKNWTEQLKFSDIFDITAFEKHVSKKHYNQFVPYETFLKDAPHKVLLVQYRYPCGDQSVWNMARDFCDTNGFELVGKECLSYGKEKAFTIDTLRRQIYSHFNKSEVVVLFEIYGGIEGQQYSSNRAYRIAARNTGCDRSGNDFKLAQPSPSVFSDADDYIQKYLNENSAYISLMIRLEMIVRMSGLWKGSNPASRARECLNNILKKWRDTRTRTGIMTTFVAMDVGAYGSKGFSIVPEMGKAVLPPVEEFFSAVYDNKTSLQEWEDTFSSVGLGRTKTSGYIAMMQKVIAVKGDVLILVGSKSGSAFQTISIDLYHKFHGKGQIIELNSKCT